MLSKQTLIGIAEKVRKAISAHESPLRGAKDQKISAGGDMQFDIDRVAEEAVFNAVQRLPFDAALYTEDGDLETFGRNPDVLFLIDPIDGTRPASADFQQSTISIAVLPYGDNVTLGDVTHALIMEIHTGTWMYSGPECGFDSNWRGYRDLPSSKSTEKSNLFVSFELNGHPTEIIARHLGGLIDRIANSGGVFVFNSATYAIASVISGQTDTYIDIGNRLFRDFPNYREDFYRVGNGNVLHLFPYDIAAAVKIAKGAGCYITDCYGKDLTAVDALSLEPVNQSSCLVSRDADIHSTLLDCFEKDYSYEGFGL